MPDTPRPCPICQTPIPAGTHRRHCSPACKTEAWRRAHPDRRPTRPARTGTQPAAASTQPAALRACPHCAKPVAIVALLTTPQLAGPQLPTDAPPDLTPRRVSTS